MKVKLTERKKIFDDVESFILEPDEKVEWQPGQYMHYALNHPGEDSRGHERWFTISSAPFEKHLQITTRFTKEEGSSFKKTLRTMQIGDSFEADGPKGSFVITDPTKKYILISGGIGITPYRSMLAQMDHDNQDLNIELLYANRDENFVFSDELEAIQNRRQNFKIHKFVGDRRIEEADFKPYLDDSNTVFYVSGPEPMVENYAEKLKQMGASEDRVKTDFFPGY
jgi:ferredoxin-NADP reductase